MMQKKPDWLTNWMTLSDTPCDVIVTEDVDSEDKKVACIEVKWNRPSTEVFEMQLDMLLNDPDISCVWKPHLSPQEDMVVGDFVFQSPAMIFEKNNAQFALVPDIDFLNKKRIAPHVMDYIKSENKLFYGLGHYEKIEHVYHKRTNKSIFLENGQTLFRFYLIEWKNTEPRDFTPVVEFLWERFGEKNMIEQPNHPFQSTQISDRSGQANAQSNSKSNGLDDLDIYAKYAYDWAFNRWEDIVWQEFELNQKEVGGCVFIVRAAQSPGFGQEDRWRERKSLWNQAWFSSLRSAYGYRLWGEKWNNQDMIRRSERAKNFALSAPQTNGLFPSVYMADSEQGWENGYWGHSDRRPENHEKYGHLLDMSWTCLWMLKWYGDIEEDSQLLTYTKEYVERLLKLQHRDGSFPAWVHEETGEISPYLVDSPETSMHVWLLTKLYSITGDVRYIQAAERGMEFVMKYVSPEGRWEDFELYWSCARTWDKKRYGEKDDRSGLYNQCNFSIYWTTEALKELYKTTNKQEYLQKGKKVLAELSLYQAIWNPEYLYAPMLGGFGVMTSDDEWNDARQSLFALTYLDYFNLTGKEEYNLRGIWAMRASFYLMYCPENPLVKIEYEKAFPHFGENDYGFEMENAHHGGDDQFHIGEFTIFDWGNGSAAASLAEYKMKQNTHHDK